MIANIYLTKLPLRYTKLFLECFLIFAEKVSYSNFECMQNENSIAHRDNKPKIEP